MRRDSSSWATLHLRKENAIFRRARGKQVSVAVAIKKGKSELRRHSRRALRKILRAFIALEIPHEQNKENHHGEHTNAKVTTFATRWGALCHDNI
jgi:hypothetical protein